VKRIRLVLASGCMEHPLRCMPGSFDLHHRRPMFNVRFKNGILRRYIERIESSPGIVFCQKKVLARQHRRSCSRCHNGEIDGNCLSMSVSDALGMVGHNEGCFRTIGKVLRVDFVGEASLNPKSSEVNRIHPLSAIPKSAWRVPLALFQYRRPNRL